MGRMRAVRRIPVLSDVGKDLLWGCATGIALMNVEAEYVVAADLGSLGQALHFSQKNCAAPTGVHKGCSPYVGVIWASLDESICLGRRLGELAEGLAQIVGHLKFNHGRTHLIHILSAHRNWG